MQNKLPTIYPKKWLITTLALGIALIIAAIIVFKMTDSALWFFLAFAGVGIGGKSLGYLLPL